MDCPYDYDNVIPFTNPVRIYGEVKYWNKPVTLEFVREYIANIYDISQNYFVSKGKRSVPIRYLEQGVIFSASGS